jgi:hypothetical protein
MKRGRGEEGDGRGGGGMGDAGREGWGRRGKITYKINQLQYKLGYKI